MRAWLTLAVLSVAVGPSSAAESDLTPLQPPTVLVAPCPLPAFEQPSRLAVWQHYAVDRQGRFRPAVPLVPGQYSPATIQPRLYIPYIRN